MKLNKEIALLMGCLIVGGLIPMTIFGVDFYLMKTQEIQLYDHYFVFYSYEFLIVVVGVILFVSFLIRGLITKFESLLTRIFFGLGLLIVVIIGFGIYEIINRI